MNSREMQQYIDHLCEAHMELMKANAVCVQVPNSRLGAILNKIEQEYNDAIAIEKALYVAEMTALDRLKEGR